MAFDSPLFDLAQWKWLDTHAYSYVCRFAHRIGYMEDIIILWWLLGWTNALTQAHQVTAPALAMLQTEAFLQSEGIQKMSLMSPTFQYWNTILDMELLGLTFIRAHCERIFLLYLKALASCSDYHNWAQWIPIHIHHMESLPTSVFNEFKELGQLGYQQNYQQILEKPSRQIKLMKKQCSSEGIWD